MQLDWRIRLALVVAGACIAIAAILGAAFGALDSTIVISALSVVGSLGVGVGVAGGPSKGSGAALLLLALCAPLAACSGDQSVDATRCTAAVLRAAQDVAVACWPQREGAAEAACPLEGEQ